MTDRRCSLPAAQELADRMLDLLIEGPVVGGGNPWRPATVVLTSVLLPELEDVSTNSNNGGHQDPEYHQVTWAIEYLSECELVQVHRQANAGDVIWKVELT